MANPAFPIESGQSLVVDAVVKSDGSAAYLKLASPHSVTGGGATARNPQGVDDLYAASSTGQVTMTGSAVRIIGSATPCRLAQLKAPTANGAGIYVGGSGVTSSNGYLLDPGDTLPLVLGPTGDLHDWYAIGTSSDKLSFIVNTWAV